MKRHTRILTHCRQADKYQMELRLRRRHPSETLSTLHRDIRRVMALAHPTLQQEAREAIACDCFIHAMDDAEFALKIREWAPPTLDEVLQVALQLEAWTRDARQCSDKAYRKPKVRAAVNDDSVNSSKRFDHLEADFNRRFDQLMKLHKASVVNPQATATKVPVASLIEFDDATQNSKDAKFQPNSRQHETQLNEPQDCMPHKQQGFCRPTTFCWRCGKPGHVQRNCRLLAPDLDKKLPGAVNRGSCGLDTANVYLRMQLGDKMLPCLLDSGCKVTLIPKSVAEAARNVEELSPYLCTRGFDASSSSTG